MKIEYVETSREEVPAPQPIYKTEMWGPKDRKWEMTYLDNNPRPSIKILGKRFVDGQYSNEYVQYI